MKRHFTYILSALFVVFSACEEQAKNNIYNVRVEFKIDLNNLDDDLRVPTATKMFTKPRLSGEQVGYGGLLVVTSATIIAPNVYSLYAYDLACPHEQKQNIRLEVNDRLEAVCPECESTFDIINGFGAKLSGPSDTGLQCYSVVNDSYNHNIFRIYR